MTQRGERYVFKTGSGDTYGDDERCRNANIDSIYTYIYRQRERRGTATRRK